MSNLFIKGILIAALMLFAGCEHIPTPTFTLKPSKSEIALQELNAKQDDKIKELDEKIANFEKDYKFNFDANISLGSASVLSVYDTMLADPDKDQFDLAEIKGQEVAIKALPEPTLEDYRKTTETQRKLLSKQAEEIAKGKKEIEAQKQRAEESKLAQKKALEEKATIEKQKKDAEVEFNKKKEELNNQIVKEKNEKIAETEARVKEEQDKKDLQKLIVKILMIFGVIAAVAAVVIKSPTAGFASAGAIALAISVSFLPMWALIVGLVLVFAMLALPIIIKYFEKHRALKNVVGATQDYKVQNPEAYKNGLKKNLEEWHEGDKKSVNTVEKTLKELNLK